MDAENRANMDAYLANIETMEKLTRLQTNLNLLKMHQEQTIAPASPHWMPRSSDLGWLVCTGDVPGELTVQIASTSRRHRLIP